MDEERDGPFTGDMFEAEVARKGTGLFEPGFCLVKRSEDNGDNDRDT